MPGGQQGTDLPNIRIFSGDPNVGLGTPGIPNQLLLRTDTNDIYYYKGPLDTNWTLTGTAGAGMAIGAIVVGSTVGSALFVGAGGLLTQDNPNFFYDNVNSLIAFGTNVPTTTYRVTIKTPAIQRSGIQVTANDNQCFAGIDFFDSGAVFKTAMGYADAAATGAPAVIHLRLNNYFYSGGPNYVFANATKNEITVGMTNNAVFLQMENGSGAAVGAAGTGKLIYTTVGQKARWSFNGGAYFDVATYAAPLTTALVPFANALNQLTQDATFAWENVSKQLQLGSPVASASYRASVKAIAAGSCLQLLGNLNTSFTGIDFYDFNAVPVFKSALGYGNPAAAIAFLQNKNFWFSDINIVLANAAAVAHEFVMTGTIAYRLSGTKILGVQGAAVADAAGGAVIDVEARAALNALLARVRAATGHGLIA